MSNKKLVLVPRHIKGEDGYKTFSVRLPEKTVNDLEELAKTLGYSRNELICTLLQYGLSNYEIDDSD